MITKEHKEMLRNALEYKDQKEYLDNLDILG